MKGRAGMFEREEVDVKREDRSRNEAVRTVQKRGLGSQEALPTNIERQEEHLIGRNKNLIGRN